MHIATGCVYYLIKWHRPQLLPWLTANVHSSQFPISVAQIISVTHLIWDGMAYCGLLFPETVCPVSNVGHNYWVQNDLYTMICSYIPPNDVSALGYPWKYRIGLVTVELHWIVFTFQTRISCSGVSGFVSGCLCGAWGCRLTTLPAACRFSWQI